MLNCVPTRIIDLDLNQNGSWLILIAQQKCTVASLVLCHCFLNSKNYLFILTQSNAPPLSMITAASRPSGNVYNTKWFIPHRVNKKANGRFIVGRATEILRAILRLRPKNRVFLHDRASRFPTHDHRATDYNSALSMTTFYISGFDIDVYYQNKMNNIFVSLEQELFQLKSFYNVDFKLFLQS